MRKMRLGGHDREVRVWRSMRGLRIEVKSVGLPIGGGLGSSAAFSVALSGALLRLRHKLFKDVYSDEVESDLKVVSQQDFPVNVF